MTRYLRKIQKGHFYHIVNRGVEQRKIFLCEADYATFMQLLSRACEKYKVPIVAYALMPNHFHILIKVVEGSEVSKWGKWFQGVYAQAFNKKYGRVGHLWQDRFYAKEVRNGFQLARTWMYVEQNPVKANLVDCQEGWRWSSAFLRSRGYRPHFLIEPSWWLTPMKDEWWSSKMLDDDALMKIRQSLKRHSRDTEEDLY